MGDVGCRVVVDAYHRAMTDGVPIIGLWHSGGARLAEGVLSLHAVGRIFHAMTQASGRIPQISVVLGPAAGAYEGLTREAAREKVVAELERLGLLGPVEEIEHNVAISDRSKDPIEPLVSEQWFVKMKPLAVPAIADVKTGRLVFVPERWTKVYLDWLENVRDWCISRQLWWGHRIPVWYDEDGAAVASVDEL